MSDNSSNNNNELWPFEDNGDGTITDNRTNLIWLKDVSLCNKMGWDKAKLFVENMECGERYCLNDESKVGDWRLPTIDELKALIDIKDISPYEIDHYKTPCNWLIAKGFKNLVGGFYWSSTSSSNDLGGAWGIDFRDGKSDFKDKRDHSDRPIPRNILPVRNIINKSNLNKPKDKKYDIEFALAFLRNFSENDESKNTGEKKTTPESIKIKTVPNIISDFIIETCPHCEVKAKQIIVLAGVTTIDLRCPSCNKTHFILHNPKNAAKINKEVESAQSTTFQSQPITDIQISDCNVMKVKESSLDIKGHSISTNIPMDDTIIECIHCSKKNRIPYGKSKDNAICGKCKKILSNLLVKKYICPHCKTSSNHEQIRETERVIDLKCSICDRVFFINKNNLSQSNSFPSKSIIKSDIHFNKCENSSLPNELLKQQDNFKSINVDKIKTAGTISKINNSVSINSTNNNSPEPTPISDFLVNTIVFTYAFLIFALLPILVILILLKEHTLSFFLFLIIIYQLIKTSNKS